jgi:hypothetical protein
MKQKLLIISQMHPYRRGVHRIVPIKTLDPTQRRRKKAREHHMILSVK